MGCCSVKKLRDKEVIDICDGRRIGYVYDVEIDVTNGRVVSLVVPLDNGKCFRIGKPEDIIIPWECIVKIRGWYYSMQSFRNAKIQCDPVFEKHKVGNPESFKKIPDFYKNYTYISSCLKKRNKM